MLTDGVGRAADPRADHFRRPVEVGPPGRESGKRRGPAGLEHLRPRPLHHASIDERPAADAVRGDGVDLRPEPDVEQALPVTVAADEAGKLAEAGGKGTRQVFLTAFQDGDGDRLAIAAAPGKGGRRDRAAIAAADDENVEMHRRRILADPVDEKLEPLGDPGGSRLGVKRRGQGRRITARPGERGADPAYPR